MNFVVEFIAALIGASPPTLNMLSHLERTVNSTKVPNVFDFSFHKSRRENVLERLKVCPTCISRFEDIHGIVYPAGSYSGTPCEDSWHRGPNYNPDVLVLTEADRKMFEGTIKF